MKKVYPSFPMSHVVDMPDVLAGDRAFRAALAEHFITFDPATSTRSSCSTWPSPPPRGQRTSSTFEPHAYGGSRNAPNLTVKTREVMDIAGDIDGQIYMRDFKLIDQST